MEITITQKKQRVIKKLLKETNAQAVIQKVVDDWFENLIQTKYQSKKTLAEKVDEIDQES